MAHVTTAEGITRVLEATRTIAVLGIKSDAQAEQPSVYVPAFAQERGFRIVPVPVYYPDVTNILGERVYRTVTAAAAATGGVHLVNVFRRPSDLAAHLDDIVAAKPKAVWLQLGIRDDAFAEALVSAGIDVVQDKCLLVELRARPTLVPAG